MYHNLGLGAISRFPDGSLAAAGDHEARGCDPQPDQSSFIKRRAMAQVSLNDRWTG